MSAHLDMLLTPSQRSEVTMADRMLGAPLTIPAPRSVREQLLMADNAALRIRMEAMEARNDELARKVAYLSADLRTLKGDDAMPSRGCKLAHIRIGEATVLVEYAYEPGEFQTYTDPEYGATVEVYRAFVGGYWHDLQDLRDALSDEELADYICKQEEA